MLESCLQEDLNFLFGETDNHFLSEDERNVVFQNGIYKLGQKPSGIYAIVNFEVW